MTAVPCNGKAGRRALGGGLLVASLFGLGIGAAAGRDPEGPVRELTIDQKGEAYRVRFQAEVALPPERVLALLTDYDRLERLHPGIVTAERLGPAGGSKGDGGEQASRVRTVVEACVAFFCRRLERVEVVERRGGVIGAHMDPAGSDFRSGRSRWRVTAIPTGSRIHYRSRWVPDFWLPPGIGAWLIKRQMARQLAELVRRLEALGASG